MRKVQLTSSQAAEEAASFSGMGGDVVQQQAGWQMCNQPGWAGRKLKSSEILFESGSVGPDTVGQCSVHGDPQPVHILPSSQQT